MLARHAFNGVVFLTLTASTAFAQEKGPTIGGRTDNPDGSSKMSVGRKLPTEWDAKVGADFNLAAPASNDVYRPDRMFQDPNGADSPGMLKLAQALPVDRAFGFWNDRSGRYKSFDAGAVRSKSTPTLVSHSVGSLRPTDIFELPSGLSVRPPIVGPFSWEKAAEAVNVRKTTPLNAWRASILMRNMRIPL